MDSLGGTSGFHRRNQWFPTEKPMVSPMGTNYSDRAEHPDKPFHQPSITIEDYETNMYQN